MARDLGATHILLLKGRISEAVTAQPVALQSMYFDYVVDGDIFFLPIRINQKSSGYYGITVSSNTGLPEPGGVASVALRVSIVTADGRPASAELLLSGADLAKGSLPWPDDASESELSTLPSAPFTLDIVVDPAPVTLHGQVLRDNDPAQPAVGATVEADALTAISDTRGTFRIGPLPIAATSPLTIDFGGVSTAFTLRPDFAKPINFRTFAI